ncbi:MAG: hemerythrin domain-containing protein [Lautropia sp.]
MGQDIEGFYSPASGPEAPLEMLSACHARVERQCRTLRRLVPHLARVGCDDEALLAAGAVVRYFDVAAVHHHEDEEHDLFPALIESMAASDAHCLHDLTRALAAEHRALEARWHDLRAALLALGREPGATLDAAQVEAFATAYEAHIAREEQELLPMAARLLDDAAIARVGRAMRERRGIDEV